MSQHTSKSHHSKHTHAAQHSYVVALIISPKRVNVNQFLPAEESNDARSACDELLVSYHERFLHVQRCPRILYRIWSKWVWWYKLLWDLSYRSMLQSGHRKLLQLRSLSHIV